ncbi:MAG TPA: ABC transporter permease [Anaerovoracaceae bacterium]|nr:ABC transporter permease [Anaerovoracaceae bacterium]
MRENKNIKLMILKKFPVILFIIIFIGFGIFSSNWFTFKNAENILSQSSYIGILAAAITLVLLTGGVDISIGSNMFLSASVAGLLMEGGWPIWAAVVACLLTGFIYGYINAFLVVRLNIVPFIATLGTMTAGRGIALIITRSAAVSLPKELISGFGAGKLFGIIPYPVIVFLIIILAAAILLKYVPLGRRIYAVGNDAEIAKKAGINANRTVSVVYITCGVLAAVAGIVSAAQIGNINAGFGVGYEFTAIAASVLGGTSMAGGIGTIFPGALIGTLIIQMIQAGLVFMQVDLYIQPIVNALIILLAVLMDSVRTDYIKKLDSRNIRVD